MINEALVAVPLFIFMGVMLEKTKIAAKLLESIGDLFGSVRGGLGIGVVLVGMLLAASTGIVGATVVTMGMLALPTMLKAGYDEKIATGKPNNKNNNVVKNITIAKISGLIRIQV